jgi:hypothetical protein
MYFAVAVPALLILLTAGAAQARPLKALSSSAGLLTQAWQLLGQWTGIGTKDGVGMDPNGNKIDRPILSAGKDRPSRGQAGK